MNDMALVKIIYRNGNVEDFDDSGTNYGNNEVVIGDGVVAIVDPYGKQTAIPLDLIERVEHFTEKYRSY